MHLKSFFIFFSNYDFGNVKRRILSLNCKTFPAKPIYFFVFQPDDELKRFLPPYSVDSMYHHPPGQGPPGPRGYPPLPPREPIHPHPGAHIAPPLDQQRSFLVGKLCVFFMVSGIPNFWEIAIFQTKFLNFYLGKIGNFPYLGNFPIFFGKILFFLTFQRKFLFSACFC